MIGTLTLDGDCYLWYSKEGCVGCHSPVLAVLNLTIHLSSASVYTKKSNFSIPETKIRRESTSYHMLLASKVPFMRNHVDKKSSSYPAGHPISSFWCARSSAGLTKKGLMRNERKKSLKRQKERHLETLVARQINCVVGLDAVNDDWQLFIFVPLSHGDVHVLNELVHLLNLPHSTAQHSMPPTSLHVRAVRGTGCSEIAITHNCNCNFKTKTMNASYFQFKQVIKYFEM